MKNPLYPIFLKLDKVRLLIVGAGEVGTEKLHFILKSSPNANIKVIAPWVSDSFEETAQQALHPISYELRAFTTRDVDDADIVIAATNIPEVNIAVYEAAKAANKIVNVADTPELCDFYMGSIVTRGDLKVGISTNGKSPTFAKRFRQWLEQLLPEETDELLGHLKKYRDTLTGDFEQKVHDLNQLTKSLITHDE